MKRARDASTMIVGTRSGSWFITSGSEVGVLLADSPIPPDGAELFLLGHTHLNCLQAAVGRLRAGSVLLPDNLPPARAGDADPKDPSLALHLPTTVGTCPFCDDYAKEPSAEDVFPKWLLKMLVDWGAHIKVGTRWTQKPVGPTVYACRDCNNTWMSTVENDAKPILQRLIDGRSVLFTQDQATLALWATMKAILVDAASDDAVVPRGFGRDLKIKRAPHRGIQVWMAAYGDIRESLSARRWLILGSPASETPDEVIACCITIVVLRVVLQIFIPFQEGSPVRPNDCQGSVQAIQPPHHAELAWPPAHEFGQDSLTALASRIYDNRTPIVETITLRATDRWR